MRCISQCVYGMCIENVLGIAFMASKPNFPPIRLIASYSRNYRNPQALPVGRLFFVSTITSYFSANFSILRLFRLSILRPSFFTTLIMLTIRKMLTTLPPELLTEVASYLNGPDRLRLRASCKSFEAAVANSNLYVRRRVMHIGKVSFAQLNHGDGEGMKSSFIFG